MRNWADSALGWSAVAECGARLLDTAAALVFARDLSRIVWSNASGGQLLEASSFADLYGRRFAQAHPLRRDLGHIAAALGPSGGLGRLRFFGHLRATPAPCRCISLRGPFGERGLLVVALDRGDPESGTPEAAIRFLSDTQTAAALLTPDGAAVSAGQDDGTIGAAGDLVRRAARSDGPVWRDRPEAGTRLAAVAVAGLRPPVVLVLRETVPAPRPAADPPVAARGGIARAPAPQPQQASPQARPPAGPDPDAPDPSAGSAAGPVEDGRAGTLPLDAGAAPPLSGEAAGAPKREGQGARAPQGLPEKPVRFLWQTDAADRILFVSPGLAQVVGRSADIVGERWRDAAGRLGLDPTGRVGQALARRDTWSGLTVWWPVEGSAVRVPAELTALPVFGVDGSFQGYRGFGVMKPGEALRQRAFQVRFGPEAREGPAPAGSHEESVTFEATNVVPIRADLERLPDLARLSPQERSAFEEIAAALGARIADAGPRPARRRSGADEAVAPAFGPALAFAPATAFVQALQAAAEGAPHGGPAQDPAAARPAGDEAHPSPPLPLAGEAAGRPDTAAASPAADRGLAASAANGVLPPARFAPGAGDEADPAREPNGRAVKIAALAGEAAGRPAAAPAKARPAPGLLGAASADPGATPDERSDGGDEGRIVPSALFRPVADGAQGAARGAPWGSGSALDAALDAVVILDADGRVDGLNAAARALLRVGAPDVAGRFFADLLTPESRAVVLEGLEHFRAGGAEGDVLEIDALSADGAVPLSLTLRRCAGEHRSLAVLRDLRPWRQAVAEMKAARDAAAGAVRDKARFLARLMAEIRAPLEAVAGFAEAGIEERFGPVGDERYRQNLRDIRAAAEHVVGLVGDLASLAEAEEGRIDLDMAAVPLNDLLRGCIAFLQPQASRAHVILRCSPSGDVPAVLADARTLRQAILDLLEDAVKSAGAGRQVIASTTLTETGEAILRIRHTGEGLSEEDTREALQPFRAAPSEAGERGPGLALAKALVEANRARFFLRGAQGEGTIAGIAFPATRVLSE